MSVVRSAGLIENYHITRHRLRLDSCVVSAAQYIHPQQLALTEDLLYSALRTVVPKHAALCVRISDENTLPKFTRLDVIDLSDVVHYVDETDLQKVIEAEFMKPFSTSEDLPLWRLAVLPNNTVLFAFHHCIGDGMSSVAFHRALHRALLQIDSNPSSFVSKVFVPKDIVMVGAIEDLTDVSPSWFTIIREVLNLFIPTSWTPVSRAWTGNPVPKETSLRTHARILQFPASDVEIFTERCRAHQATITSALHFLVISSLSSVLQSPSYLSTVSNLTTIASFIPVSLRPQTGASPDAICDQPSTYQSYPIIKPSFSWSDASKLASALRAYARSRSAPTQIGLLKYLFGKYEAFFQGKLGNKRQGGLELSNLGRFDINIKGESDAPHDSKTDWQIQSLAFAQCDAVVGSAFKTNVASAPNGNMTIVFTWGDAAVDGELMESFVSRFKDEFYRVLEVS